MKSFYCIVAKSGKHRIFIEKTRGHKFVGALKPNEDCLMSRATARSMFNRMMQSSTYTEIELKEVTVN
jgi:hypothetical protein